MELTPLQQDALVELINIGFGRAAASLSKLTGHRVQLEVPEITMCPIEEMGERPRPLVQNEVASVHQIFSVRSRATRCWCSISAAPPSSRNC